MRPASPPWSLPSVARFGLLLCRAFCTAACAAGKPRFEEVLPEVPALQGDQGRFVFFVPKRSRHAAWKPMITLNGRDVGRAVTRGFFYVDVPAGEYVVAHRVTTTVQGKRNEEDDRSRKTFELKPGETLFVQMVLTPGAGIEPRIGRYDPMFLRPVLAEPEHALEEVKTLRYTGKDPLDEPAQETEGQDEGSAPQGEKQDEGSAPLSEGRDRP